jgi:hypothetical protein
MILEKKEGVRRLARTRRLGGGETDNSPAARGTKERKDEPRNDRSRFPPRAGCACGKTSGNHSPKAEPSPKGWTSSPKTLRRRVSGAPLSDPGAF